MLEADHLLYPRLRPVEAFPVQMKGQELVCVRDPQALAEQPIFLNQILLFLVSRMDGKHGLRDIQADYFRAAGEIIPIETLEHLVTQLDEQHYLDGPSFRSFHLSLVQAFRDASSRPPRHAGTAYEENAEALASQIQSYFVHPDGPGNNSIGNFPRPLRGLIAPHIDFVRGGPTYARAYQALAVHPDADTYVIFGTCHMPMPQRFSISKKNYETPLGAAIADQDFIGRLSIRLENEYLDDFPHRAEHSIEFQTVCLRYILGNTRKFKIVPILVNSFHDICSEGRTAAEDQEITAVVNAIRETIEESPGRTCIIAGADLAHVGRQFGDDSGPTEHSLNVVDREDRLFLKLVEEGDAEGVFRSIASDNDSRRVCGYPPIYMTLRCIDQPEGKLLQYRQWSDLNTGAAVTYAALALF
jgi:AmmeMemoRadiSam system protein B